MAKATKKSSDKRPVKVHVLMRIQGTSPLLFNPATEELVDNLIAGTSTGKDRRPAEKQAESKLLKNTEGCLVIPRSWVFACGREAGRQIDYKPKTKITSGTQGTKLPALLKIHGAEYVIHDGNGVPIRDWKVDKRKGTATQSGAKAGAVGIVRPRIDLPWFIDVPMTIKTTKINPEKIRELWEIAGEEFGLGDGRPGKGKLDFGMFEVVKWEITGVEYAKEETAETETILEPVLTQS